MDSAQWDRRYAEAGLLWSAGPNRFLVSEVESLPPGRALDLACGEGRNAVWLAERGWSVTGVDFSRVALEKAARIAAARSVAVEWVHRDLLEYEPAGGAFDLVIVLYLQVPEEERREILRRAAAAVAPAGTLLVVAHDRSNLERGHGGPRDPRVLATAEQVAAELEGLAVLRAGTVTRAVETAEGERVAIDLLVRAQRAA